jgi:hypothetical protein
LAIGPQDAILPHIGGGWSNMPLMAERLGRRMRST